MRELLARLDQDFDDAEGWVRMIRANWMDKALSLDLEILFGESGPAERWQIRCVGLVEERLSTDYSNSIRCNPNSPLLKLYQEPCVDVMFVDNKLSPEFLFGLTCSSCLEVIGRAEVIGRFLNQSLTAKGISSSTHGLLGRFPQSVATHILTALRGKAIRVNALPGRMPSYWNGERHVPYPALQVIEIGSSYVIAERFEAVAP